MLGANRSASFCVIDGDVAGRRVQRRLHVATPTVRGEPAVRRHQIRAGFQGQLRRAGGHARRFSEEVDLHARAGQVALGHEAHDAVVAQPFREHLERGPLTARQRQHLEPEAFAIGDESVVQRLRFESFVDGGEGAEGLCQPHPGHIPVAAVRQRQDRTAPRVERGGNVLPTQGLGIELGGQCLVVHRRQTECLPPVTGV